MIDDSTKAAQLPPDPGAPWNAAFRWIESELGGNIRSWERQARWRPAFFLDVDRGDESLQLYLRCARPEVPNGEIALQRERSVLQELEARGIPVPHVYGFTPDPAGIVMDRAPGRANLATAESEAERTAVLGEYIEILARMHRLELAPFEAMGFERPTTPEALARCDLARWEAGYRKSKSRPEPLIEFVLGWLQRNVPANRTRATFVAADSGQFMFADGRITALLDLELACLGDPAADLAGLRGRDLSEPLGDLSSAFERYFELTGESIPNEVIDYHTVRFNLCTPLAVAPLVATPPPGIDLVQYLGWYWVWSRACLEVIAHGMGLELEGPPPLEEHTTPFGSAHDALVRRLRTASEGADFASYEVDAAYRTAEYLRRAERFGAAQERDGLEEASALLGRTLGDSRDADARLESLVEASGPDRDAELVRLFHRRCLRREALLRPVLRELDGASIQLLERV